MIATLSSWLSLQLALCSMFRITATLDSGLVAWFLTPGGNQQLNSLLGLFRERVFIAFSAAAHTHSD